MENRRPYYRKRFFANKKLVMMVVYIAYIRYSPCTHSELFLVVFSRFTICLAASVPRKRALYWPPTEYPHVPTEKKLGRKRPVCRATMKMGFAQKKEKKSIYYDMLVEKVYSCGIIILSHTRHQPSYRIIFFHLNATRRAWQWEIGKERYIVS